MAVALSWPRLTIGRLCVQADGAVGIPHRRTNQLQVQDQVHLVDRGLVSIWFLLTVLVVLLFILPRYVWFMI